MEPFSEERTQGPNQIPSAVVLWTKPSHGGFGNYAIIGTMCVESENVVKSTRKKTFLVFWSF